MDKKKIGILTYHRADNLGAVLQAYALQQVLLQRGHATVEIVDYYCENIENSKQTAAGLKGWLLRGYYYWKHRGFEKFRVNYLNCTAACTKETIAQVTASCDAIVVGSDQVWNYECSGWDDTYFLDFAQTQKRYAYAASIGNYRYTPEEGCRIKEMLQRFLKIAVREESAKRELQSIGVNEAKICVDPVILLEKECWMHIMARRRYKHKYVFIYLIQEDVHVVSAAQEYAKRHNCKVISNKSSVEFILHGTPRDFLSWVYYSDCVFTNSFHGTAFALLFNKPLVADIALRGGGVNSRVSELIKAANAENCLWNNTDQEKQANAEVELAEMRAKACAYIDGIFREL